MYLVVCIESVGQLLVVFQINASLCNSTFTFLAHYSALSHLISSLHIYGHDLCLLKYLHTSVFIFKMKKDNVSDHLQYIQWWKEELNKNNVTEGNFLGKRLKQLDSPYCLKKICVMLNTKLVGKF